MALTVQRNAVDESVAYAMQQNESKDASGRIDSTVNMQVKSLMRHFAAHAAMAIEKPPVAEKLPVAELGSALTKLLDNVMENADVKAAIDEISKILQKIIDGKAIPPEAGGQSIQAGACPLEQPHAGKADEGNTTDRMQLVAQMISQLFKVLLNAPRDETKHEEGNQPESKKASPFESQRKIGMPAGESIRMPGCGVPDKDRTESPKVVSAHQSECTDGPSRQHSAIEPEAIAKLITLVLLAIAPLLAKPSKQGFALAHAQ